MRPSFLVSRPIVSSCLVLGLLLASSLAAHAEGTTPPPQCISPYGLTAQAAVSTPQQQLCQDMNEAGFVFDIAVFGLTKDGNPLSGVETPLDFDDAHVLARTFDAMKDVLLDSKPAICVYDFVYWMVTSLSPDETAKLRNTQTLMHLFEVSQDQGLSCWQDFGTTVRHGEWGIVTHTLLVNRASGRVVYLQYGTLE